MGLLGKLLKTAIHVVTTPAEVVKDIATMGGVLTDQKEPYTVQRAKRLNKDVEEVTEDVSEL